jgi:hypothetical protein
LEKSRARPNPRITKTGLRRNRKKNRWRQYDIAIPVGRMIINVTGTPSRRSRNGGTPVGYSGRAAIKKEQCDMMPESQNIGDRRAGHARQRLGKHVIRNL